MAQLVLPQNSNHTVLPLVFKVGSLATDVTGAVLTGRLVRIDANPVAAGFAATGAFVVSAGTNGNLTYQPSLADTATAGEFELQVKAVFPDTTVAFSDRFFFGVRATD